MKHSKSLGLYNPQLSDNDTLDAILVKYQPLLNTLTEQHLRRNCFTLICGPHGAGKTHLATLFEHRLRRVASADLKVVPLNAAVGEIVDAQDFMLHLLEALKQPLSLANPVTEAEIEQALSAALTPSRTVLIMEHVDGHLDELSDKEKRRIKALVEQHNLAIFGTALHCPATNCPVAGLFEQHELTALSLEQAAELMLKVAKQCDQSEVVDALSTPKGSLCIKALHHLAAGIPRLYVNFTLQVKQDPLEEFTDIMQTLLDGLSPQYQGLLSRLPSQQRKLIGYIARQPGTVSVGAIASANRITHQTTSGQLKKLRDAGLVVATSVGRSSHYEIADPLMRLTLGLERAAIGRIGECVLFLRHWFSSGNAGYLAEDRQCFIYDKQWLKRTYASTDVPKLLEVQKEVDAFVHALPQGDPLAFAAMLGSLRQFAAAQIYAGEADNLLEWAVLMNVLICQSLTGQTPSQAVQLCELLFEQAQQCNSAKLWKRICRLNKGIVALFASAGLIESTLPFLTLLENQESKLGSQAYSIGVSHCLISKAKGYALLDDHGKCRQALDQLRIRAEKRNSLEIAGAFCHGVKETIGYIVRDDERLAAKLLKQVEDMSAKYRMPGLAFACARNLWTQNDELASLEYLLKRFPQMQHLDGFNYEVYQMMNELAMRPLEQQIAGYAAIWQALQSLGLENIFAAALNRVSVTLAASAPKRFDIWLSGCESILSGQPMLTHSCRLLQAVADYLQKDCDKHQLLVLPREERLLVLETLN